MMNPIGVRLRELREKRGKSASALAAELGMSTQRYWHLENGDNGRTFEKLPRIAKALDCRIDDLFPEMDDVKTDSAGGFENESLDDFEM